jgi:hypothetical protein
MRRPAGGIGGTGAVGGVEVINLLGLCLAGQVLNSGHETVWRRADGLNSALFPKSAIHGCRQSPLLGDCLIFQSKPPPTILESTRTFWESELPIRAVGKARICRMPAAREGYAQCAKQQFPLLFADSRQRNHYQQT